MSRGRCDPKTQIPGDLMVTYYTQRSDNGFILTESTPISLQGNGFPDNGALYNDEQSAGW
jgi:N-ethylmaleimide reductase